MTGRRTAPAHARPGKPWLAARDGMPLLSAEHAAVLQMFAQYQEQEAKFILVRNTSLDLNDLGARMAARKQDPLAQAA